MDAHQDFPDVEGFDDVVVGAMLESGDAIDRMGESRDHHDRHVALGADLAGELQTVLLAEQEVERDQIDRRLTVESGKQGRLVAGFADDESPFCLKSAAQRRADGRLVVDDQNLNGRFMRTGQSAGLVLLSDRLKEISSNLHSTPTERP